MRIVIVNWARIAEGASSGGGVNGYCQGLALELARRGHDVIWLSSGLTYVPTGLPGVEPQCRVRRHADHRGVRVFEIVNSPVIAPGPCQMREPLAEVSAPALEAEITRFFGLIEPDIVHFHNIEGMSAACVDAARTPSATWAGARTVFSLHNYHTVCPQVYLMQGGRRPCFDFDNGHACTGCIETPDPGAERRARAAQYRRDFAPPPARAAPPPRRPALSERLVRLVVRRLGEPIIEPPWPGRAVEAFRDTVHDAPGGGPGEGPVPGAFAFEPDAPEWRPLENVAEPDPPNARPLNDYGRRRKAMVEMLSRCDRVLAVSRFVHAKFEALGVRGSVLRTVPIGSRMADLAAASPELLAPPPPFEGPTPRPVRLLFMGYHNYYKGLPMLCDALELLTPEVLRRFHLTVNAKAVEEIEPRLRRLEGRLAGLTVERGYGAHEVPRLCSGKDLGVVPSVWWDNGPQTVMEFLACGLPVLGAELGGIPDLVEHGVNGLLHRGNDRFDLARTLAGIAREPSRLFQLRRNVRPPRSMGEHAPEVERVYAECLGEGG